MALQLKHLSNRQFEKYCVLVYRECGIKLNDEKRALLDARIAKRLRLLDISPDCYYEMILENPEEMARFIDAVSTNHTYFFRESECFQFIHPNCKAIWCAACSSGEEPYSLAAYCLQQGGCHPSWPPIFPINACKRLSAVFIPISVSARFRNQCSNPIFRKG